MIPAVTPAIESEKTLLGALLLDSSCYLTIKDMLCGNDFSCDSHNKVFEAIRAVFAERGTFNIAMVSDHGTLDSKYLYQLANDCCSTANVKAHAEIIREKSVQRQLLECAKEIDAQKEG
jgi:replicative DNA helicase